MDDCFKADAVVYGTIGGAECGIGFERDLMVSGSGVGDGRGLFVVCVRATNKSRASLID